jgi:hypothetical protein
MAKDTISIAFPQGGIIPASVIKAAADRHCEALEVVEVPLSYGKHLISDRFAVAADPVAKAPAAKAKISAKPVPTKDTSAETLLGSNTLPAMIDIADGKSVQLGEVVMMAHKASGLSIEDWNSLPDDKRDEMLLDVIDGLKA